MSNFYNANKILSMKDKDGKDPEIYMICGNRTAGKTFFFKRWIVRRFVKYGEKFVVLVRTIDDVKDRVLGFWEDVGPIAFPGHEMTQEPMFRGKAGLLKLDGKPCGYVVPMNKPEFVRNNAAAFADAERIFFDEFMSETGVYLPKEMVKFNSVRISIGRGGAAGKHTRRVPVYMCSNNVTLFNPYWEAYKIPGMLQNKTKYLRGKKWVLEQTFNEEAAAELEENFGTLSEQEINYAAHNEYLLDNKKFVDHVPGIKICACKIRYNGKIYGVWGNDDGSMFLISTKLQSDTRLTIVTDPSDHNVDSYLVVKSHPLFKRLKQAYELGHMRFESMACKYAYFEAMCIKEAG